MKQGAALLAVCLAGLVAYGCADDPPDEILGYMAPTEPGDDTPTVETSPSKKLPKKETPTALPEDEEEGSASSSSSSGTASSSSSSTSSSGGSSSSTSSSSSSTSSSSSSSSSSSTSSSSSSSGNASSSSSSSSSSGGTSPAACATTSTCNSGAVSLGYISGDSGSDVAKFTGTTSRWLRVVVGEDSISGASLRMRATLTSPPGTNFDLFIHTKTCSTPTKSSTKASGLDTISHSQPDVIFGGDDDYLVLIEVRHVSGDCSATSKWELKVEGNR